MYFMPIWIGKECHIAAETDWLRLVGFCQLISSGMRCEHVRVNVLLSNSVFSLQITAETGFDVCTGGMTNSRPCFLLIYERE